MGIAFSIVGTSLLLGTPVEGALLRIRVAHDGFSWFKSIIFCGVSFSPLFFFFQSTVFFHENNGRSRFYVAQLG